MRAQTYVAMLLVLALGGCAQLQSAKPGTPVADIIKQLGGQVATAAQTRDMLNLKKV